MTTLTSSPLSYVDLPGVPRIELKGLLVLVGPNSSGKTNVLRDLEAAATGFAREFVVCDEIGLNVADSAEIYVAHYLETGDLRRSPNGHYLRFGYHLGKAGNSPGEYQVVDVERQLRHVPDSLRKESTPNDFLSGFGILSCASLFLENRLQLTSDTGTFDAFESPAQNLVQSLFMKRSAQHELEAEISREFARSIWLDASRGNMLALRLADGQAPSLDEQRDPQLMRKFRSITTEGEGIRSYVAVCATLLLGRRPLVLVDEPEQCLHPPQARSLGRFIGRQSKGHSGCVVVATHSSGVLRGILETNGDTTVVRLRREPPAFLAHLVEPKTLQAATVRPASRAEPILDGLFANGVVICEGEGDRVVYESAATAIGSADTRLVSVGGLGGVPHPARLYRTLGVRTAVIVDADALAKNELADIVEAIAGSDARSTFKARLIQLRTELRKSELRCTASEIRADLRELAERDWDFDSGGERELRARIRVVTGRLSRFAALKSCGTASLPPSLRSEAESIVQDLKKFGVFLVPVGELESWLSGHLDDVAQSNKPIWATRAAQLIEESEPGEDDIWAFMRDVNRYLTAPIAHKSQSTAANVTQPGNSDTPRRP